MTAPLSFEVEEAEGADLGSVFVAGQACVSCGIPSYTGTRCTRCAVAGAPDTGFWDSGKGAGKILAQNAAERIELVPPEMVCGWGSWWQRCCDHFVPDPIAALDAWARSKDWQTLVGHSRGRVVGGTGRQLAVAELWSVRFRRGTWQGYAVRRGDAWDSVCIAGETLPPFLALGVTELRAWLADPERPGGIEAGAWVENLKAQASRRAVAGKIVKCPGPGECAWVDEQRGDHTHRANGEIKIKTTRASTDRKSGL